MGECKRDIKRFAVRGKAMKRLILLLLVMGVILFGACVAPYIATENDLLGWWTYETTCHNCPVKNAKGTLFIEKSGSDLIIKGHIIYSDGTEFNWIERAHTDGRKIWSYAVNDRGDVGTHEYVIISKNRMESSWTMSNGAHGTSVSERF